MKSKRLLALLTLLCMVISVSTTSYAAKIHPDNSGTIEIKPHTIIGNDNRQKVTNTLDKGPNAVCKLIIKFKKPNNSTVTKYGSGFLYSRRNVGTAGHCVYDAGLGLYASQITIEPGISPSRNIVSPQTVSLNNCHIPSQFVLPDKTTNWEYDYAAIVVPKEFPSPAGFFGLDNELSDTAYKTQYLTLAGYDAKSKQQYKERSNSKVSYVRSGDISLRYDTVPGMSGSPIYNDARYVVGIFNYGVDDTTGSSVPENHPNSNTAQRMNDACFNFLTKYYIAPTK